MGYLIYLVHCNPVQGQYRDGLEKGFLCVAFPQRETPVFNTGFPGDENRFFPAINTTQGKLFSLQGWVCSV